MTLNSSGPISLAGTTAGVSIEIENGGNGTTMISLNDTAVRTLAGVPSGAITMPTNFYGKSNRAVISYTFTSSTANASLNISSIGGYSSGKSDITVTVNSGVYLYATSTGNYGLNLSGGTTGDTLTLVNNGYIAGQGGGGGFGGTSYGRQSVGGNGGPALNVGTGIGITINNVGYIGGGGGGGGLGGYGGIYGSAGGGGAGGGTGGYSCGQGACPCNPCNPIIVRACGGSGGSTGSSGANGSQNQNAGGGGGGGRIFAGTGGSGGGTYTNSFGRGGGSGGGGSGGGSKGGGAGGSGSSAGSNGASDFCQSGGGGGGAGWGAAGGFGYDPPHYYPSGGSSGGSGGKAINKNGNTVTFSAGCTRVYGAVS